MFEFYQKRGKGFLLPRGPNRHCHRFCWASHSKLCVLDKDSLHTLSSWKVNKTQQHQHGSHNINKHAHTCTYNVTSSQPANKPAIASISQSSPSFTRLWALWKAGAFAKRNDSSNSSGDVSGKFKDSMDVKPRSKPRRAALKRRPFLIFWKGFSEVETSEFFEFKWQLQVQMMLPFRGRWRQHLQGPVVWHVSATSDVLRLRHGGLAIGAANVATASPTQYHLGIAKQWRCWAEWYESNRSKPLVGVSFTSANCKTLGFESPYWIYSGVKHEGAQWRD